MFFFYFGLSHDRIVFFDDTLHFERFSGCPSRRSGTPTNRLAKPCSRRASCKERYLSLKAASIPSRVRNVLDIILFLPKLLPLLFILIPVSISVFVSLAEKRSLFLLPLPKFLATLQLATCAPGSLIKIHFSALRQADKQGHNFNYGVKPRRDRRTVKTARL